MQLTLPLVENSGKGGNREEFRKVVRISFKAAKKWLIPRVPMLLLKEIKKVRQADIPLFSIVDSLSCFCSNTVV